MFACDGARGFGCNFPRGCSFLGCVMNGDDFRRVVLRHKDRVHTYAAWVMRDVEEARDVTQQSLLRLWEHRGTVSEAAAATWLRRTAHRLCVDRLRRQNVARNNGDGPLALLSAGGEAGGSEATELCRSVAAALAALPERDRAVIVLREMDGLSYEQMSEIMEMPLGTLKAALHRARERLRRALTGAGVLG